MLFFLCSLVWSLCPVLCVEESWGRFTSPKSACSMPAMDANCPSLHHQHHAFLLYIRSTRRNITYEWNCNARNEPWLTLRLWAGQGRHGIFERKPRCCPALVHPPRQSDWREFRTETDSRCAGDCSPTQASERTKKKQKKNRSTGKRIWSTAVGTQPQVITWTGRDYYGSLYLDDTGSGFQSCVSLLVEPESAFLQLFLEEKMANCTASLL